MYKFSLLSVFTTLWYEVPTEQLMEDNNDVPTGKLAALPL